MPERYLDYPFHLAGSGRTADTDEDDHIRDLIHQVLFTSPGERVNRPDFGCALKTLVFQPNRDTLVGATRTLVHGALQRWLEREIVVEDVAVQADESTLTVQIVFTRRDTGERQSDVFTQAIGPAPAGAAS